MKNIVVIMVLVFGMLAPSVSQAKVLKMATGATLGGLAGSLYINGAAATTVTVSTAAATVAEVVTVSVAALAAAVVAVSTPVLVGIIVGGGVGLLMAN